MKSPFPGMDPYLEAHWRDVHHNPITFAQGAINRQLPTDLRARIDKRLSNDDVGEGFINIVDVAFGSRVVSVIEFLTLSCKTPGKTQRFYRWKQDELRRTCVSLIEVDLLRAGQRISPITWERIPKGHQDSYASFIRHGWKAERAELYFSSLREPLPTIGVPLRKTDPGAPLNLQTLIDQCYENGRYDDLDYRREPVPPLDADDAAWADALLRQAGKR